MNHSPPFDLAPGFIDIHCHLLPGLDDGPRTPDVAVHMCALAQAAGTVAVIATPHANHRFVFDPQQAAARRSELEANLERPLRLFGGCEVELSYEMLPAVFEHPAAYTLAGSRYLLVELMPTSLPPNLERVFSRLLDRGVVPVLAHPERHALLLARLERLESWVARGVLVQLTADALTGRRGARVQGLAVELLRRRLAHFVASDGHDPVRRPPRLLDAYRAVHEGLSPQLADRLFIHNPRAVLEDRPIPSYPAF
jgi:protein-tyrosine phosphatase